MTDSRLTEKYIAEYSSGHDFAFIEHISVRISNVEIAVDVFEFYGKLHGEKAHVIFTNGDLTYECDCCDKHNYETDFHPVVLNGQNYIIFRKSLYGFTIIDAETPAVVFEYFPEIVLQGEESFIITDVKQLDELLIFEGCY